MSDPYTTPGSELSDPPAASPFSGRRHPTGRLFGVLSVLLGLYLASELSRVVVPAVQAAWQGTFSWDLVLYGGLLLIPLALLFKGGCELIAPGWVAGLWRREPEDHQVR